MKTLFNWLSLDIIKYIFQLSTQCARTSASTLMKKNYHSPFPSLNIKGRNAPVATDTIYYDASTIDDSSKYAQAFVGTKTIVSYVYGMKYDK